MTEKEKLIKNKVDKIVAICENVDKVYELYNTREVLSFLGWKQEPQYNLNDWLNTLSNNDQKLVQPIIEILNIKVKRKGNNKMEEIKQEQIQPTVTVVEKPKVKRAAKRDASFYEPIIKEIDELKASGKKVSEIMNHLKEKYKDVNTGTLMSKYFAWKRSQPKQGE